MNHLLEVCVDSLESALAAQSGGADRLELCANLLIGGTSPSPALIEEVLAAVTIPVNVLLRPRFGDFCFTDAEKRILIREVETCRDLGVHGVVLGALLPDGRLDRDHLAQCIKAGGPNLSHTLHRAFDLCRDPFEGLEDAVALGFDTILTSGQQAKAIEGAALLGRLVEKAAGRIQILAGSGVKTCSVIGFPFGTHTTAIKVAEAEGALADGADEIDMVINVGRLLDGDEAYVQAEVAALVEACHSRGALLKVIIETCYLNEEQIAAMCRIVEDTGADFIKTSTGYGSRGAEPHDIELFKKYLKKPAKMKASGGIRTTKDAQMYVDMGCARLGTSNGVQIMEGAQGGEAY